MYISRHVAINLSVVEIIRLYTNQCPIYLVFWLVQYIIYHRIKYNVHILLCTFYCIVRVPAYRNTNIFNVYTYYTTRNGNHKLYFYNTLINCLYY